MLADVLLTSDRIVRKHFGTAYVEVFRLRYHDGLAVTEIARKLKLPISDVKLKLHIILSLLRKTLQL